MKILLFLLLFNTTIAAANSGCETISNLFNSPRLQKFPEQGGLMWCFAFATAKIINFETGEYVNPYSLAVNGQKIDGSPFSPLQSLRIGGYIHTALRSTISWGYCTNPLPQAGNESLEYLQNHFDGRNLLSGREQTVFSEQLAASIEASCSRSQLIPLRKRSMRLVLNPQHPDFVRGTDRTKIFAQSIKILETGKPLAIGYLKKTPSKSYNHGAVIVRREVNEAKQSCEFLISDSEVNCTNTPEPDCQNQISRISQNELEQSIIEINFFRN